MAWDRTNMHAAKYGHSPFTLCPGFESVWCIQLATGFAVAEVTSILDFGMPSILGEGRWSDDLAQLAVPDVV